MDERKKNDERRAKECALIMPLRQLCANQSRLIS